MRKILLMRLFYLKKLDFKQLLQTYENHIIPSPACYISGVQSTFKNPDLSGFFAKYSYGISNAFATLFTFSS